MKNKLKFFYLLSIFCSFIACQTADPCKNKDCGNGDCLDGVCDCDPGYKKDASGKCSLVLCDGIDCVHGTCVDGVCDCDPGYGLDANGKCTIDSCAIIDCVNGTCVNGVCDCDPGYSLDANGKCTVVSCAGVDCGHGTCVDGLCNCDPGYERDASGKCTVVSQAKFVGSYDVSEDCSQSFASIYVINISAGTSITDIKISNFWNIFFNYVQATVSGNTLTIPRQAADNDGFFVEGTGVYSTNASGKGIITLNYTVTDENSQPHLTDICTSTIYTKQ